MPLLFKKESTAVYSKFYLSESIAEPEPVGAEVFFLAGAGADFKFDLELEPAPFFGKETI